MSQRVGIDADDVVVAVDLGGSLTKIGYVDRSGRLHALTRVPTPLDNGPDGLVGWLADQVAVTAAATSDAGRCRGVGVAVPGILDPATGVVRAAANLGWHDVDLRERLTTLTGLAAAVTHDVRAGGLAEWRLGAGRGVSNLLFLALGTGIAGAVVVDGRLLAADGYAGEIGHLRVGAAGDLPCACGQRGCLETVASAAGVLRTYLRHPGARTEPAGRPVDAAGVATLARAGDVAARKAYGLAVAALGEALTAYLTLLGPELVIVGGGLSAAHDLVLPELDAAVRARVAFQRVPRLVPAELGAEAGVIGAGLVAWDRVRAEEAADG